MAEQNQKHIIDLTSPGIELIFRDNCYIDTLHLKNENLNMEELTPKVLEAMAILAKLFLGKLWILEIAPILECDILDKENCKSYILHMEHPFDFHSVSQQVQKCLEEFRLNYDNVCLCLIQEVGYGMIRIALPDGVDGMGSWNCVDCDGNLRSYQVNSQAPFEELSTVWIDGESVSTSNEIRIQIDDFGEMDIYFNLSSSLFQPTIDPRAAEYQIRSRSLIEWQKVNGILLNKVKGELEKLGFQSK